MKHTNLRKIVYESDLGLCEMSHIGGVDLQRVSSPFIDLTRRRSPEDVIKENIAINGTQYVE
jgi:hypothetical protein